MGWFMPNQPSPTDPASAIAAWARLRRLMRRMLLGMVAMVALAAAAVWRHRGQMPVRFAIVAALGMGLAMVVISGAMGLATLRRARRDAEAPD